MKQVDLQEISAGVARAADPAARGHQNRNGNFERMLSDSIQKVNSMQLEANEAVKQLAAGKKENIHETMIAVQKASISFQFMSSVRNKALDAYQEVMRMQV